MEELTYPRQKALQNPESCATLIHAIIREKYGEEAYDWDPTTIYLELKDDFKGDICTEAMDKWCAIQVLMTSDAFFKRLDAFMSICNTFADGSPFFWVFNPVTPEEIAWTLAEVALNRELLPFSYTVKEYVREVLKQEGYAEGSYPGIFSELFDADPNADDLRDNLAALTNDTNIEEFVTEQLGDLVSQFGAIPDMSSLDNMIRDRGFEEAITARDRKARNENPTNA